MSCVFSGCETTILPHGGTPHQRVLPFQQKRKMKGEALCRLPCQSWDESLFHITHLHSWAAQPVQHNISDWRHTDCHRPSWDESSASCFHVKVCHHLERWSPPKTWRLCLLLTGSQFDNNILEIGMELCSMLENDEDDLEEDTHLWQFAQILRYGCQQDDQDLSIPRWHIEDSYCTQCWHCALGVLELTISSWIDYSLWPNGRWTS